MGKGRRVFSGKIKKGVPYPEFVPSFDHWITMDEQKEKARHLQEITNVNDDFENNDGEDNI